MTSRYTATICHHSISQAREINVGDTLAQAKHNATREFGDGFLDHKIIIYDAKDAQYPAAWRLIRDRKWHVAQN